MKKSLLITLSVLFATFSYAQEYETMGWYNYGYTLETQWGLEVNYFRTHIWPDSLVWVDYSDGMGKPWMHGLGEVLDPTSSWFDDGILTPLTEDEPYMVDSIAFFYAYFRPQTEVEDTVIIQFFKEENFDAFYEDPWEGDPTYGGRSYGRIAYDSTLLRAPEPFLEIVEIMDSSDVSEDVISAKSYYIGEEIEAGEVVAMSVTFIPGNPFNVGDTLDHFLDPPPTNLINDFVMYYYYDNDLIYDFGIYDHGIIATDAARYYINDNGWAAQYWPGIASGGGLYHGDVAFHISRGTGITDQAGILEAVVAYPNPFEDEVQLSFSTMQATSVDLEIHDLTGRLVYQQVDILAFTGDNVIEIGPDVLTPGVYVFSLSSGDDMLSGRIVKK